MTDTNTAAIQTPAANGTATAAPKVKPAPKPVNRVAKATAAKPAPKGKKAPAAKPTSEATGPKPLGTVQIRLLTALAKAADGLTGVELAAKAEVHPTAIGNQAGYRDAEINSRPVHASNLLNRGFVKLADREDRGHVYTVTAAGRKALEKAAK